MQVDRIYISGHRRDVRFTRCAVTSIRQFYPDIPITLIKDELNGAFDTAELESLFGVEIFETPAKRFGWGMAKLEPLFLPYHERCLILDSDTVFLGPVLDRLEASNADFVVELCDHDADDIRAHYFDLDMLATRYPDFRYPGYVFNTGQLVARTGILRQDDFEPFITFSEPREQLADDIFAPSEQGILNYVLFDKQQRGEVSIERVKFMKWPPAVKPGSIRLDQLDRGGYPFLLHWAGPKRSALAAHPLGEVLKYFEVQYYRKLNGR